LVDLSDAHRPEQTLAWDGVTAPCGDHLTFSADGERLIAFSGFATCVFRVADGQPLTRVEGFFVSAALQGDDLILRDQTRFSRFDANGQLLASSAELFINGSLFVALSPAGDAAVVRDPLLGYRLIDPLSGAERLTLVGDQGPPLFSPDGSLLLWGNHVLRTSDNSVQTNVAPRVRSLAFALSPDGEQVLSGDPASDGGQAQLLNVSTGNGLQVFGSHARPILGLATSQDGQTLVSTTGLGLLTWLVAPNFSDSVALWSKGPALDLYAQVSPDGAAVAVSGEPQSVLVAPSGQALYTPLPPPDVIPGCEISHLAFSPSGDRIAGADEHYFVDVRDSHDFQLSAHLPTASCNSAAAFSSDGSLLATSAGELYRTRDWARLRPPSVTRLDSAAQEKASAFDSVRFLPNDDEHLLLTVCSNGVPPVSCRHQIYTTASGAFVRELSLDGARPSFSSDAQWIVAGGSVARVDGVTPPIALGKDLTSAVFTSDDDIIAGGTDGRLTRFCRVR
jgi:WD40 repeat protein